MPLCPGMLDASRAAMGLYMDARQYTGLYEAATRYIARKPADGWGDQVRSYALQNQGKWNEAYAELVRATELGYGPAFEQLAWYYEGGRGGVKQDFRKAIDLYM